MRRLTLSLAVMAFLLAVLVGCAGKPSTGATSGDGKRDKGGNTDEKQAGSGDTVGLADLKKKSVENLTKIGHGFHNRASAFADAFPAHATYAFGKKPLLSWRMFVLPFIDEESLFDQFKEPEPWNSPLNMKLLAKMPKVYTPVAGHSKASHSTYYQLFVGAQTAFDPAKIQFGAPDATAGPNTKSDFPDGLSNTIIMAEAGVAVPWTKPEDIAYDPKKPLPKLGGMFPDGFHVLFADGTVRFVRKDFDEQALRDFINPASGKKKDLSKILPRSRG